MIIANITNRIPYLIPYNFSISLIFPWYWEKEIRYYVPKIITINIISLYLFLNLSNNTFWEQYKLLVDLNFITLVNELLTDIVMIHFDNLLYFSFSSSLSIKNFYYKCFHSLQKLTCFVMSGIEELISNAPNTQQKATIYCNQ